MPDADSASEAKTFYTHIPAHSAGKSSLKGSGSLDWGMQNRLAHVFRLASRPSLPPALFL
jgi:hypothetical protein